MIASATLMASNSSYQLPRTMRAFCYSSAGLGNFKWSGACRVPSLGRTDILVKVSGAGFNHMDYFAGQIAMLRLLRRDRPGGFDLSGTVVSVGKNVADYSPGDRVFGFGQGFSEYARVKPWMIHSIPKGAIDLVDLAGYPSVGVTALQIVKTSWIDRPYPNRVKNIVIIGASGGVGSSVLQICRLLGPGDVNITAVSSSANEQFCRSLGASTFIDYSKLNGCLSSAIEKGTTDLIIDTVSGNIGTPDYVKDGMQLLSPSGIYVATNSLRLRDYVGKIASIMMGFDPLNRQFQLFMVNPFRASADLAELTSLIENRKFRMKIDERVPFTEEGMRYGLEKLEGRHASGKRVISVFPS